MLRLYLAHKDKGKKNRCNLVYGGGGRKRLKCMLVMLQYCKHNETNMNNSNILYFQNMLLKKDR